jgi:hypothetical protein
MGVGAVVSEGSGCGHCERELVARWLLEAEVELRRAQAAVEQRRPCATARYATARADHGLAVRAAEWLLAFAPGRP